MHLPLSRACGVTAKGAMSMIISRQNKGQSLEHQHSTAQHSTFRGWRLPIRVIIKICNTVSCQSCEDAPQLIPFTSLSRTTERNTMVWCTCCSLASSPRKCPLSFFTRSMVSTVDGESLDGLRADSNLDPCTLLNRLQNRPFTVHFVDYASYGV